MILMRLKDADTLIETICHDCTYRCNEYCREIKHIINAPTVDAVPVVRCKDCIYWYDGMCGRYCTLDQKEHSESYYCADGERKDGDNNA